MIGNHARTPLRLAALVHRLSGLALALFLPVHFYVLGLALEGEQSLDGFLHVMHPKKLHPLPRALKCRGE